ncbi:MAG: HEAT repeat domain-containing protein [Planctomycetota bacterium]
MALALLTMLLFSACDGQGLVELSGRNEADPVPYTGGGRRQLAEADEPDIDELLTLATSADGEEASRATAALMRVGDDRCVPLLRQLLAEHAGTTHMRGFAVAQALFRIGTPEAHEVLRRYVLADTFFANHGIRYIRSFRIPGLKRDAFVAEYLLQSTSKDIGVEVKAASTRKAGRQRIKFTVAVRNDSDLPVRILNWTAYQAQMLVLRSPEGHFTGGTLTSFVDPYIGDPPLRVVMPEQTTQFHATCVVRRATDRPGLSLRFDDTAFRLAGPGRHRVYAMYEYTRPRRAHSREPGRQAELQKNPWYGRAVSAPVEIRIHPVAEGQPDAVDAGQRGARPQPMSGGHSSGASRQDGLCRKAGC